MANEIELYTPHVEPSGSHVHPMGYDRKPMTLDRIIDLENLDESGLPIGTQLSQEESHRIFEDPGSIQASLSGNHWDASYELTGRDLAEPVTVDVTKLGKVASLKSILNALAEMQASSAEPLRVIVF